MLTNLMKQCCEVHTKGQLLAAFRCAASTEMLGYDVILETEIILHRKTGITRFYLHTVPYGEECHKQLRRAIGNLRKIPAADLLA
jgi:hypothetical protein